MDAQKPLVNLSGKSTTATRAEAKFSLPDVERLAGATRRKIGYWAEVGLVRPTWTKHEGKRVRHFYSFDAVLALRVISLLSDIGMNVERLKKMPDVLNRLGPDDLLVISPGGRAEILTPDGGEDAFTRQGLMFATREVYLQLRNKIIQMEQERAKKEKPGVA